MILSINNRIKQKALSFLRSQKKLPLIFLVSQTSSGITIEVDDDDADDLLSFLDSKGFEYEEEKEEDENKVIKEKSIRKATTEVLLPPNNTNSALGPWPY